MKHIRKRIVSLLLGAVLTALPVAPAFAAQTFSDVSGHWAEKAIYEMTERGVMEGVGDGLFMPDKAVTRAEFITLAVRGFDLKEKTEVLYTDVTASDWFYESLLCGAKLIPAEMTTDGRFLADSPITREEMAAVLATAVADETTKTVAAYSDEKDIADWVLPYVAKVTALGYMQGDAGAFMPRLSSTRAQAAAVLQRALPPAPVQAVDTRPAIEGQDWSAVPMSTKEGRAAYPAAEHDVDMRSVETSFGSLPQSDAELAERFPIRQQMRPLADMRYIAGVGMVAYFEEGGPREVYVRRESHNRHDPAKTRYKQFCTARVIDPDGEVVCYYDFSEKDLEDETIVFTVPEGKAGIYQISYKNGQNNVDDVTIGIPNSNAWGIRGEPTLTFTEKTDKEWYLYIPRTSKHITVFTRGSQKGMFDIYDENGTAFSKDVSAPLKNFDITDYQTDVVWRVVFSGTSDGAITFVKGVPQILCPTEEMARFLKGCTQEAEGLLVSGELQAQLRKYAYSIKDHDFTVDLNYIESIPDDVTEFDIENLMYGIYSGYGQLERWLPKQCLDPESPYFGGSDSDGKKITEFDTWEDFDPPSRWSLTTAIGLASLVTIPTKLNMTYGNEALKERAVLNAFCHLISMDNQQLIREGSGSANQFWPNSHSFFIYPSIAGCYNLLKDKIDPEAQKLFRRALILLGDNLANNVSSQSNQWNECIMGHLEVYMATGEKRFLEYYERNIVAASHDNVDRASGSYGQHPAGYFMEQHGPDGSYQELSMHKFVGGFLYYKNLPEAKPEVIDVLTDAIDRAVTFESLFWLPQPDGTLLSPNAMNTRSTMMMCNQGYPGFTMAATVNPLAAKVLELMPVTPENVGTVQTMPQGGLNKPTVSKSNILQSMYGKDKRWPTRSDLGGGFIPMVYNAYRQPERVRAAGVAPVFETDKIWDLKGMLSFKRGKLYGLTFYDANSISSAAYPAAKSPLPFVLWTEKLGSVVLGMNNKNIDESDRPQMGYSGILFRLADGSYYKTCTENSTFRWITEGSVYEMECNIPQIGGSMKVRGKITADGLKLTATVSAGSEVKDAWLCLPINVLDSSADLSTPENGCFTYGANGETLHIDYNENMQAELEDFVIETGALPKVRMLKIELPLYNRPLELNFYVE